MNILDYFPHKKARPSQITALEWLAEQDAKYLLLEAPVGVGKSAIGICYSRYLANREGGDSFILTPQKILQDQYVRSFVDGTLASLYGKSNYDCQQRNTTCDIGGILKPKCNNCPYSSAVVSAKNAPNTVFNYQIAMLLYKYTQLFDKRDRQVMILDECHTVEEHLCEFNAVTIYQMRAQKFGVTKWPDTRRTDIFQARDWTEKTYLPAARANLLKLSHKIQPLQDRSSYDSEPTNAELKLLREHKNMKEHVEEVSEFVSQPDDELTDPYSGYVLIFEQTSFKFKMLRGARNFKRILEPYAERFLFMSSTILNRNGFAEDLGLPPEETAFLSLDSEFPAENRQVYFIPQMKMNRFWKDAEHANKRTKMVKSIKTLLSEIHAEENGIIHTGNYAIAEWLVTELSKWSEGKHEIVHHNPSSGDDRAAVIRHFINNTKPSVLISPSITEGLDLVEHLARFAIFCKVPYGFLGDQWIKCRQEQQPEWYQRRAIIDIIQGGGRVVRSSEDTGTVYILDESFGWLYSKTVNTMIPDWWKEAYSEWTL